MHRAVLFFPTNRGSFELPEMICVVFKDSFDAKEGRVAPPV